MPRKPTSTDGRTRVHISATISARAHDLLMHNVARMKGKNPKANIGQAIDSIADFAKVRRFDPIKIKRPAQASTPAPAKSATPSGTKV